MTWVPAADLHPGQVVMLPYGDRLVLEVTGRSESVEDVDDYPRRIVTFAGWINGRGVVNQYTDNCRQLASSPLWLVADLRDINGHDEG